MDAIPTDRGKASKKSILVGRGRRPERGGGWTRNSGRLESMWWSGRKASRTCAWTRGMTTPRATEWIPAHPAYWRGEAGPIGREDLSQRGGGWWAHPELAVQVPGDTGALYLGLHPTGMCPYLVPPGADYLSHQQPVENIRRFVDLGTDCLRCEGSEPVRDIGKGLEVRFAAIAGVD